MARRKRALEPVQEIDDRELEREFHWLTQCLSAREPGNAEADAKEALIFAEARRLAGRPPAKKVEAMRECLTSLGLRDRAERLLSSLGWGER